MNRYCLSCGAPVDVPEFKGPVDMYCKYCTDEKGNLHPREAVRFGIAKWLQTWQPGLDDERALERAGHYMQAMPAWAAK